MRKIIFFTVITLVVIYIFLIPSINKQLEKIAARTAKEKFEQNAQTKKDLLHKEIEKIEEKKKEKAKEKKLDKKLTKNLSTGTKKALQKIIDLKEKKVWGWKLKNDFEKLAKTKEYNFGVYVKEVKSGKSLNYNGEKKWYLASTVKVPIAIEFFRQLDMGKVNMNDEVTITRKDYRDGSGNTNWLEPGSIVTLKYLLEQMLIKSDNAATDKLISILKLENINNTVNMMVGKELNPITTILQVRRHAYSNIHKKGKKLSNMDYIKIRNAKQYDNRYKTFVRLVGYPDKSKLKAKNIREAFETYYATGLNAGTLKGYSKMLRYIIKKNFLTKSSVKRLLDIMRRCKTGKERIVKGLGKNIIFAHKTGTQVERACDIGYAAKKYRSIKDGYIIAVCAKQYGNLKNGEKIFAEVGKLVRRHIFME